MNFKKRAFDLALAVLLLPLLLPIMGVISAVILLMDGRPVFYMSERMKSPTQGFQLIKFRTMRPTAQNDNDGVTGADKSDRITRTGRFLRRHRLDELPQLFNVLRGDISFVGPRPPLRSYVEQFPTLYQHVLASRPGITGMATVFFHAHEEWLLARCTSPTATHETYARRCVPRKARLDIIYQNHWSIRLDLWLLARTLIKK